MDWLSILSVVFGVSFFIVSIALILVILIQRPQGGGLAGAFGGGGASSQSAFGAKTGDMLTVATVTIFILFLLFSIGLVKVNEARFAQAGATAPAAPSQVTATADSDTSVTLKWKDNSDNEVNFMIYRSPDGTSNWTNVGTVDANATTFTNNKLTPETKYFYRVQAINEVGPSAFTKPVPVTTLKKKSDETPSEGPGATQGVGPAGPVPNGFTPPETKPAAKDNQGDTKPADKPAETTPAKSDENKKDSNDTGRK